MSKFYNWVADGESTLNDRIFSDNEFESSNQRQKGFIPGTSASSKHVNTALRQANLVACAMIALTGNNDVSARSNQTAVQNALDTYFNTRKVNFTRASSRQALNDSDATNALFGKISKWLFDLKDMAFKASVGVGDIDANAVTNDNIVSVAGSKVTGTVASATDVTTNINGKVISTIFEDDGTTVKNATRATIANNYNSSSGSILSKFDEIESRLTLLGFKTGTIRSSAGTGNYGTIYRQGNYVYGTIFPSTYTTNVASRITNFRIYNADGGDITWQFMPRFSLNSHVVCQFVGQVRSIEPSYTGNYYARAQLVISNIGNFMQITSFQLPSTVNYLSQYNETWFGTRFGYEATSIS